MALLLSNVAVPQDETAALPLLARILGVRAERITAWRLVRKSLDARPHPPVWRGNYRVEMDGEDKLLARRIPNVRAWTERDEGRFGDTDAPAAPRTWTGGRVIVVGAGPAGMFAAMFLAEAGVPVLLLDRGGQVDARVTAVNSFWRRKSALDPENNLLFGEGGAGTFSDAKIYTRRRDAEIGYVLRRFVDCGAKPEILEEGLAHLGTDKVREILPVFRAKLRELGAEVRFDARVVELVVEGGRCTGVVLADGSVERGAAVIVAPGHSARDTVGMLVRAGAAAVARPVAIGARVEHPQAVIDRARYGVEERGELPPSSYRLAWHPPTGQKARTFCMCPGGIVVPAMNVPDRVVVNGMSFAAQRGFWANSAVIVDVDVSTYGAPDPLAGFRWQDEIEARAFELGGGDYGAPAQRVEDLLAGVVGAELPKTSYPLGVRAADLRQVLPDVVIAAMVKALRSFSRDVPGFVGPDAVLIAPETRTTSPVAFTRDERGQSVGLPGLWPSGEGAGYGGGIVSCALDGVRVARGVLATG